MTTSGGTLRALLFATAAMLFYGGWAAWANAGHGPVPAARAATAQGALSFGLTFGMTRLLEWLFGQSQRTWLRLPLAGLGTPLLVTTGLGAIHLALGTPEVLMTIAPSALFGTIYSVAYTLGLLALQRRGSER